MTRILPQLHHRRDVVDCCHPRPSWLTSVHSYRYGINWDKHERVPAVKSTDFYIILDHVFELIGKALRQYFILNWKIYIDFRYIVYINIEYHRVCSLNWLRFKILIIKVEKNYTSSLNIVNRSYQYCSYNKAFWCVTIQICIKWFFKRKTLNISEHFKYKNVLIHLTLHFLCFSYASLFSSYLKFESNLDFKIVILIL